MIANPLLEEILKSRVVTDKAGNTHKLRSEIGPDKGRFLWSLIENEGERIQTSVEIGCAFGISSLYICDALSQKSSPHHLIIDPFQTAWWHRVGIYNLERAGFLFYELIEEPSEIALPGLLQQKQSFDFAFIDGFHTFDHALVDFFYINRLLQLQGIVVFDDVNWPAVKKVVRYIINNYPGYTVIGSVPAKLSKKRQGINALKKGIGIVAGIFPESFATEFLDNSILKSDSSLSLNADMIALRKTAADERASNWFIPF